MQVSLFAGSDRSVLALLLLTAPAVAQGALGNPSGGVQRASIPPSLDQVPVPRPSNLSQFVKNEDAAVLLGKVLFWDQQVGGDGRTACATCHHAAGVDSRVVNTMNPGPNGVLENVPAGGRVRGASFPILTDDVVGSQGVADRDFLAIVHGSRVDSGSPTPNAVFGTLPQVTGRQAPSSINAIFNEISFWDGRAANTFDGRSVGNAGLAVLQAVGSGVAAVQIQLLDSSAASQSVGPPNSDVEMAWAGRTFPDIAKKLLSLRPLGSQLVHPQDSVLGARRHPSGRGITGTYAQLVRDAFQDAWWNSSVVLDRNGQVIGSGAPVGLDQFSLLEANFSLFWGLAIQLYEATLISDNAPYDRFARGDASALSARQQQGMELFFGAADCDSCHGGAEFTNASVNVGGNGRAFAFIGVDPLSEDPGNAEGEFKTAQLRNVELTGPYFHNGKYPTLRSVVDFYNRGGDVPNDGIKPLGLSAAERDALVDFLLALTDDDVRFERAPFDHPSLNPVNRTALPAVGAGGASVPLRPFLGLSPFNAGPAAQ